jgi:hypothetical protein
MRFSPDLARLLKMTWTTALTAPDPRNDKPINVASRRSIFLIESIVWISRV